MSSNKKHIIEYSILALIIVVFVILFWIYRYDKCALLVVSASGSIFYSLWGLIHHAVNDRLTRLIAIEYLLFGFFVFLSRSIKKVILWMVTFFCNCVITGI